MQIVLSVDGMARPLRIAGACLPAGSICCPVEVGKAVLEASSLGVMGTALPRALDAEAG